VRFLQSATGPVALLIAVAIVVLVGAAGAVVDAVSGTQGWWIALGSLGLSFAALWLAAAATRAGRRLLVQTEPDWDAEIGRASGHWPAGQDREPGTDDAQPTVAEHAAPLAGGGSPGDDPDGRSSGFGPR
jgi:hypothetical protein